MAEKKGSQKAETKPVQRVVLMEFTVERGVLPEVLHKPLQEQIGDVDGMLPEQVTLLVPVARADGGPKAVINDVAKTPGIFRAVTDESYGQAKRMEPPPPDRQLVMKDLHED